MEPDEQVAILRQISQHEDNLLNDRMTWLSTFQTVLFAGFGFVWKEDLLTCYVQAVFCILGFGVALSSGYILRRSEAALDAIDSAFQKVAGYNGPPLKGRSPDKNPKSSLISRPWLRPWRFIPLLMMACWSALFLFTLWQLFLTN